MYKFTLGHGINKYGFFLNDYYYSELNSDSCVKVLYTKKDQLGTKIAAVQDKILPQPQKIYTGMPVTPVTNSRAARLTQEDRDAPWYF